jgi:type I restriction enzyme M protein
MLDTETKRRIDSCRNILVGKVPDPKSQVEQITIALIYKFMDDMDAQAEELGGKRSFFVNGFQKYSWSKLLAPGMGGQDTLNLYSEAIGKMTENTHLPALFRDIFKNAYLPYRDPETLRSFLKEIDHFEYSHSEKLGDAFEYLLSVLGSQGDAGQFRTPRHIIDFMVEVIAPQKHERILDPACGTAGFLISAWKYIQAQNQKNRPGDLLTPSERAKLAANIHGYDISPDMVRLSLVNLYLHGFTQPNVEEYDTLTSEDKWNEQADVILANPPFMSPKGGIKPHKRFSVQATRSEVLFVDYMAEHLTATGRAAIVVPEGIIFQSGTAYKALRKMLVDTSLVAVVSLPAGVFNPYSGVKTSILILDKRVHKQTDKVLFVKVQNDGFNLGAQRRAVVNSDLPQATRLLRGWMTAPDEFEGDRVMAQAVERSKIGASGDFNLSGERYLIAKSSTSSFPMVPLSSVCNLIGGATPSKANESYWTNGTVKWISSRHIDEFGNVIGSDWISESAVTDTSTGIAPAGSVILISRVSVGKFAFATEPYAINQDLTAVISKDKAILDSRFLFCLARELASIIETNAQGIGVRGVTRAFLGELSIPLPPLEVQHQIVAEIEGYQKIIDGARQVLGNYKPSLAISPEWASTRLDELCHLVRGSSPRPQGDPKYFGGAVPRLMVADITRDGMRVTPSIDTLTEEGAKKSRPMQAGSVVMAVSGNPGLPAILELDACIHDGFVGFRDLDAQRLLPEFLYYVLLANKEANKSQSVGAVFMNLTTDQIREFVIPLPDLETQRAIVAEIEAEQALVNANRELIRRMEAKIKAAIDRVWGSGGAYSQ